MPSDHILLIHSDPDVLDSLQKRVVSSGCQASIASDVAEAAWVLSRHCPDIIMCQHDALKGRGADFLEWVQERLPDAAVVVLSSWADFDTAIEGLKRVVGTGEELAVSFAAQELERQYPGITRLKKDSNGFLILGDR